MRVVWVCVVWCGEKIQILQETLGKESNYDPSKQVRTRPCFQRFADVCRQRVPIQTMFFFAECPVLTLRWKTA